ncbi:sugar transferase [Virgibacillus pantothenticus]|nr:sugar transferase [Virgibacillus pantothenticus]
MYRRFLKRPMDFILSLIAIIVLSPLLIVIAILVKTKLGTPILFKQRRPGMNEEIFTMYKFRTMTNEEDDNGYLLPDSERLTKFGEFLRSTSLDELPELFNILKGDMSIVGPRPLLERYLPYYSKVEKLRHTVRPGLTGLAQVNGRNNLEWSDRLEIDIEYVRNINLLLDLSIILKTITKTIRSEDITVVDKSSIKDLDDERRTSIENKGIGN